MDVPKSIIFKQVGAKIAYYRTLRGLHQVDLAQKIGMSKSVLSRIERGKYNENISLSVLLDIAQGLQIDVAILVTFNEQEKRIWWEEFNDSPAK